MGRRVIVVGSGGAGLVAAVAARRRGADVMLLSKTACERSNCTAYSGGLFSLSSGSVPPEEHYARVMRTGRYMNDPALVRMLSEESEATLRTLSDWGVTMDIEECGRASSRRSAPSGIMGGGGMVGELAAIARREGVEILEYHAATRLLAGPRGAEGVEAVDWRSGRAFSFGASAVVLATGGGGAIYERTDNPVRMTGDGYALALEAGLELADMEFVQFYPMGWDQPGYPVWMVGLNILDYIPLTDEGGREFLREAFPAWGVSSGREANLFARDRAAVLMAGHILKGGKAMLHLEELTEDDLAVPEVQIFLMIDLPSEKRAAPVQVSPLEHYFCGGVPIDSDGRTRMPGLYACGEVSAGVDGASRMGGNALTNVVVFGLRAGIAAAAEAGPLKTIDRQEIPSPEVLRAEGGIAPGDVRRSLRRIVQRGLSPWRSGSGIRACLAEIEEWRSSNRGMKLSSQMDVLHALEMNGMYLTAEAVARAALAREESRGVHFREDFPDEGDCWRRRVAVSMKGGSVKAGLGE